jgi:hypothetical protein
MPLPPWVLVSPTAVVHHVRDEGALRALAEAEDGLILGCSKNLLRRLVDPSNKKAIKELPQHQKQWQLLQKVKWLQRVDDATVIVPIIGDAAHFVKDFAEVREQGDMIAIDPKRLGEFLTDGTIRRDGTRVDTFATKGSEKGSKYRWRLLATAPADADQHFLHVAPGYPTAPPAGSCRRLKCPFCLVAAAPTVARDTNVRTAHRRTRPLSTAPLICPSTHTHLPLTRHSMCGRWVERVHPPLRTTPVLLRLRR